MIETKSLTMLPPAPDKCSECAVKHAPTEPHNQQSLYYQIRFYQTHGRYPTWDDALAHCPMEIQNVWREELQKHGITLAAGTIIRQNNSIKETLVQMETQCLQSPPNQVDKHE